MRTGIEHPTRAHSINSRKKSLVVRRAEQWRNSLPELPGCDACCEGMERRLAEPRTDKIEVVRVAVLPQDLEAKIAVTLTCCGGQIV